MKVQLEFIHAYIKHLAAVSIIQIWVTKKHFTQARYLFFFINIRLTTLQAAGLYYAERGRNRCKQPSASLSLVRCRRYQLLTGYAVTDGMRNKLLMLGPERNSEFCFPRISSKETLRFEGRKQSLLPYSWCFPATARSFVG